MSVGTDEGVSLPRLSTGKRAVRLHTVEETSMSARAGSDFESVDSDHPTAVGAFPRGRDDDLFLQLPSTKYLDGSDWSLLVGDIDQFIDDCRSKQNKSNVSDRAFGRQTLHLFTQILSELGHIDVSNKDERRNVVRAIRQLSMHR